MKLHCSKCRKPVYRCVSQIKRSKTGDVFCSRSCSASMNNSRNKRGENHPNFKSGAGSYRSRAIRHYGAKCQNSACPLVFSVPERMLDVHHVDEDRKNNKLENLIVLCVYCHAGITRNVFPHVA